VCFICCC